MWMGQSGDEPPAVSSAEVKRRKCLSAGDLEGAAAAEVALLTAVLDAQFGRAHIDPDQGLITVQVGGVYGPNALVWHNMHKAMLWNLCSWCPTMFMHVKGDCESWIQGFTCCPGV